MCCLDPSLYVPGLVLSVTPDSPQTALVAVWSRLSRLMARLRLIRRAIYPERAAVGGFPLQLGDHL